MTKSVKNTPVLSRQIRKNEQNETIGRYLLSSLQKHGIKHIFGVPGDYILRFDKLIEETSIKFINATRENTAGYIADAYARQNGIGCACITYGVGINIVNAVAQAYVESSPLIVISGAPGLEEFEKCHALHHLINKSVGTLDKTQLDIFKNVTVAQLVLEHTHDVQKEIDDIIKICLETSKPVYIELPRSHIDKQVSLEKPIIGKEFPPSANSPALKEAVNEVIAILKEARHPVIWLGHEIQRFAIAPEILKFAEKYRIPIVTSLLGKSAINEKHPLFIGVYQGDVSRSEVLHFMESCDTLLVFGVLLNDLNTGIFTVNLERENIILATPSDLYINHHHYEKVNLQQFVEGLNNFNLNLRYRFEYPANIDREIVPFEPKSKTSLTVGRFFECLQTHISPKHLLAVDIGDSLFGSIDITVAENSYIACSAFASLGFAVPAAIGAQFAQPAKRPIAIVGDGAFQMCCMELSTAVRYGLNPIVIVLNNHGYGTERIILEGNFNDIVDWKYHEIPKVLGAGIGKRVVNEEQLEAAMKEAIAHQESFYLIEVELDKLDFSPGMQRFMHVMSEYQKNKVRKNEIN